MRPRLNRPGQSIHSSWNWQISCCIASYSGGFTDLKPLNLAVRFVSRDRLVRFTYAVYISAPTTRREKCYLAQVRSDCVL
jgi:hypothetical protein